MDLLLLTGASGFLGDAVLDKLMNNQKYKLLLLVRADSQHTGLERVKEMVANLIFARIDYIL